MAFPVFIRNIRFFYADFSTIRVEKPQKKTGSVEPVSPGGPRGSRTPNLLIRSQMLYPIKLWVLK